MHQWVLFSVFLVLVATASDDNFRFTCNGNYTATQQRRYALEPSVEAGSVLRCCAKIETANAEARFLLLELRRLSTAACADAPTAAPQTGEFILASGKLMLSENLLCKVPSVRYVWATGVTEVCFARSHIESGADGAARLFAFSAVAARSVCETGSGLNTSPASSGPLEYVFAPDEPLSNLPSAASCNANEDYLLTVQPENASASAIRAEVLATPGAGGCRELFVQGLLVADVACFAVAAGSHLTIAYNRSLSDQCERTLSFGFVVHLEYYDDAILSSAASQNICATDHRPSSKVLIISLCTTALVLLSVSVGVVICARRAARRKRQRRQQSSEIVDMHDNELYETGRLKS